MVLQTLQSTLSSLDLPSSQSLLLMTEFEGIKGIMNSREQDEDLSCSEVAYQALTPPRDVIMPV